MNTLRSRLMTWLARRAVIAAFLFVLALVTQALWWALWSGLRMAGGS